MFETFAALAAGFLGLLLGELRRRQSLRKISVNPPPPDSDVCKRCVFFRQFVDRSDRDIVDLGDTQIIKTMRFNEPKKGD
jgi:hypothetical protein